MQSHLINLFLAGILTGLSVAFQHVSILMLILAIINIVVYCKYENDIPVQIWQFKRYKIRVR
jgi:hypothetical protein